MIQLIFLQELCASLDSIDLASFDWSSEVEAEERRKVAFSDELLSSSIHSNSFSKYGWYGNQL